MRVIEDWENLFTSEKKRLESKVLREGCYYKIGFCQEYFQGEGDTSGSFLIVDEEPFLEISLKVNWNQTNIFSFFFRYDEELVVPIIENTPEERDLKVYNARI